MASKKDMRREDLIVPYVEPDREKSDADFSGTMASTLPMMAMFTRNKMIAWTATVMSLQGWLAETEEQKKTSTTPAYFTVGMSFMSLLVTYMPLFFPERSPASFLNQGSGTRAPPPAPPREGI